MKVRYEAWGAWVRTEQPPALVALDRDGARAVGLDGADVWRAAPDAPTATEPLEVHVAVTSRCGVGCEGCYLDATPDGAHVPIDRLLATIDAVADAGAFVVAFGGGEPILRDDLDRVAGHARARGLVPVVTTSGLGLTRARAARLRAFAQVNVSYDGAGATYATVRGVDAADEAERAIALLREEGVRVGVNVVLTRASFDALDATLARAHALGAIEAQLLRYKPAGRAARLDYLAKRLAPAQVDALAGVLRAYVARPEAERVRVRIDCALLPFLSTDAELTARAAELVRFGVLGCEAGGALAAVRADGRVAGCSFAPPGGALSGSFADDPDVARLRAWGDTPNGACASCQLARACRGGCKIVSRFLDPSADAGPDPECPRARRGAQRPS